MEQYVDVLLKTEIDTATPQVANRPRMRRRMRGPVGIGDPGWLSALNGRRVAGARRLRARATEGVDDRGSQFARPEDAGDEAVP